MLGSSSIKGVVLKNLSLAIVLVVLSGSGVAVANTSPYIVEKKFSNCNALNKVYPGGVAKSLNSKNKGREITNTPAVNAKVYQENSGKDRDKDGIACEN